MTIDYFEVGVSATYAVIDNQLTIEDIEPADVDAMFAADHWYSYERDDV